jgi:hypothetical protein
MRFHRQKFLDFGGLVISFCANADDRVEGAHKIVAVDKLTEGDETNFGGSTLLIIFRFSFGKLQ